MKVGVVGAGWAGLSAAFRLDRAGHKVTVFDATRTAGGRARRLHSTRLDADIDNGQHILSGAYSETLGLIDELGLDKASVLFDQPLTLLSADGHFGLRAAALPAPLHLASAVMTAHGLSWRDKWRLVRTMQRLHARQWTIDTGLTVLEWLKAEHQSDHIIRYFWRPICLAALNTPIDLASAQLLATVLRDSLGATTRASHLLIPRVDLSRLWPEHLPTSITIHHGLAVRHVASTTTHVDMCDERFDAIVIAASAPSTARLLRCLPQSAEGNQLLARIAAFEYRPIATLTLKTERPWGLPHAMLMLDDAPERLHFGQWLFDRSVFSLDSSQPPMLCVVASDARELTKHKREDVAAAIIEQVTEQTVRFAPMPTITAYELVIEKHATFAALPDMQRPGNATPWSRIWIAGDWTDTGYPAVLEGAVRSGRSAAELIMQKHP